jgi:copper chaperone
MKLIVEGMTCGHCVRTVTYALQALDANASVSVDLPGKTVLVRGDIRAPEATQALAAQGYDVIATDEAVAAAPAESGSQCCGSCKAA